MPEWHVYMVRCRDGALYTGIAADVSRRFAEHRQNAGKTAKSLRGRGPLRLVFKQEIGSRRLALRVEGRIKKLRKPVKERLITQEGLIEQLVRQARKELSGRSGSR